MTTALDHVPDLLDDNQRFVIEHYAGGALRGQPTIRALHESSDRLLAFLMVELSRNEDCEDFQDMLSRLSTVHDDISVVLDQFEKEAPAFNVVSLHDFDCYERFVVDHYQSGEYGDITRHEVNDCGDGLLQSLISMVGLPECKDKESALRIMKRALSNVNSLEDQVRQCLKQKKTPRP